MAGPYATSDVRNYLGFGKQAARGTGVAPTVFLPYVSAPDLDHGQDGDDVAEAGIGPFLSRRSKRTHAPKGGGSIALRPKTFAQLAAFMLGADVAAVNGSLFDHTTTPAHPTIYLTAEHNLADDVCERFVDAAIIGMKIDGPDNGGDIMAAFSWEACTPEWRAAPTVETYETGISGSTPGGAYKMHEATYTVDGSAATDVQSWSIDAQWKIDAVALSKVTRTHIVKLQLTVGVTVKQLMLAADADRIINYGTIASTAADKNFKQDGAFVVALDNGLTTTNARTTSITVPRIAWGSAKKTGMDPTGAAVYLERTGVATKPAAAELITVLSKTADATSYLA